MPAVKEIDVMLVDPQEIILHPEEDMASLRELAESIKQQGLIEPIKVRKVGQRYQLIDGYRRLRAAQTFGIKQLRAEILETGPKESLLLSITANAQRLESDPLKEGELFAKLSESYGMLPQEIAEKFGRSLQYITDRVKLLQLQPELQKAVKNKEITLGIAAELAKLSSREDQLIVGSSFIREYYTVERAKTIINTFQEYKKSMSEKPKEEILKKALAEPLATCNFCGQQVKLSEIQGMAVCKTCWHGAIYLMEKEKREHPFQSSDG